MTSGVGRDNPVSGRQKWRRCPMMRRRRHERIKTSPRRRNASHAVHRTASVRSSAVLPRACHAVVPGRRTSPRVLHPRSRRWIDASCPPVVRRRGLNLPVRGSTTSRRLSRRSPSVGRPDAAFSHVDHGEPVRPGSACCPTRRGSAYRLPMINMWAGLLGGSEPVGSGRRNPSGAAPRWRRYRMSYRRESGQDREVKERNLRCRSASWCCPTRRRRSPPQVQAGV